MKEPRKTYAEKLKDVRWQKKRMEVLEAANYTCRSCYRGQNDGISMHVHHPVYEKNREPWEYDDLVAVCDECHAKLENAKKLFCAAIAKIRASDAEVLARAISGTIERLPDERPHAIQIAEATTQWIHAMWTIQVYQLNSERVPNMDAGRWADTLLGTKTSEGGKA